MTLKVTIRFFTTLREIVGKKEEQLEFSKPANVNTVLKELSRKYGKDFDDYMFDELGDLQGHLQILVNGQSVSTMKGMSTKLNDGDQLAILPPVGGG